MYINVKFSKTVGKEFAEIRSCNDKIRLNDLAIMLEKMFQFNLNKSIYLVFVLKMLLQINKLKKQFFGSYGHIPLIFLIF